MYYFYRIQRLDHPNRGYIGFTSDLKKRLAAHNGGCCDATRPFKPWKVVWYSASETEEKARAFEKYLKTGSGSAFAKKQLWCAIIHCVTVGYRSLNIGEMFE